ncbi:MAG: non-homologous end-joining DNA ligase [Acidobacteria bacterium]|nr:non-homologous end-joining DNA ligase [Acidobacteriota bacterium]
MASIEIPGKGGADLSVGSRSVRLTNLQKPFWKKPKITKGDLIQYYADVADVLLPHIKDRPMVMKRYPNGWDEDYFFMKRAPEPRPDWILTCPIRHSRAGIVDYPLINNLSSLLWVINLGCIDLNPWYGRCPDTDQPDYLHFDLDPVPGATFENVRETALVVRDTLVALGMKPFAKTTGSRGIHVYVAIRKGPMQKEVWTVAKAIAFELQHRHPDLVTAQYMKAKRPRGRVLVDYNQNAWGRTLASIYSVRPTADATVSMPVTWKEIENGIRIEDFTIFNARERIGKTGDLWKPLLGRSRFNLDSLRN